MKKITTRFLLSCLASIILFQLSLVAAEAEEQEKLPPIDDRAVTVRIGNIKAVVPPPNDFVEVGDAIRELFPMIGENRLLCVFVRQADLPLIGTEEATADILKQYAMLQVWRKGESEHVTPAEFEEMASQVSQQQDDLFQDAEDEVNAMLRKWSEDSPGRPSLEVGKVLPLGPFLSQEDAVGFLLLMESKVVGTNHSEVMVCGVNLVLVKDKVVFAYVYEVYEDDQSLSWVRQMSKEWVQRILDANK